MATKSKNQAVGVLGRQLAADRKLLQSPVKRMRGGAGMRGGGGMRGGARAIAKQPNLPPAAIKALQPYVINLRQGQFSAGGAFTSSPAQVAAILKNIRQEVVAGKQHLMLYAHGGLVSEDDALRSAYNYYRWWEDNDVYPVYFVWETSILETIEQFLSGAMLRRHAAKPMRDVFDWTTDPMLEVAVRASGCGFLWAGMKRGAELAGDDDSGALYFLRGLVAICKDFPSLKIHAVGHSAGSIFHSYVLPSARAAGLPGIQSLHLLAPAAKMKLFRCAIVPLWKDGWIANLSIFTMHERLEKSDNVVQLYRKSLLYLIFHALELLPHTAIAGLQQCLVDDPEVKAIFGLDLRGRSHPRAEAIWSESNTSPSSASKSHSHGGFDDDKATMESVVRRILGKADGDTIVPFPGNGKASR